MQIRCPHCQHPTDAVDETLLDHKTCPSCGSDMSLVTEGRTLVPSGTGPRRVGHFELLDEVGVGGFGTVWKARDTVLDRIVALKMPRRGQLQPAEIGLFFRDARAAAQLRHPGIVSVHEVGRDGDTVFIASDFIDGADLKAWLQARQVTVREAAALVAEIAEALHHAHERGVVHRDLKPGNILMDCRGRPHITDFGLAKRESGEVTMTVDGQILGTPAYMSPEQARGKAHEANAASDVYSLGVILFELMTGELPFRGEKRMLIVQIVNDDPPQPRRLNSQVSRDLQTICLKCLEKDPRRRYASALALADELRRVLRGEPILARPVGPAERLWRWSRRQPVVAALAAGVLLSLAAGAVVSTYFAWHASLQRERALAGKRIADERLELANQAVSEMLIEVGAETLRNVPQMESVRAALLDKALRLYLKIGETSQAQDERSRHETAMAHFQIGQVRRTLGNGVGAEQAYQEAIRQFGALARDFPAHQPYRHELALSHLWLGELLRELAQSRRGDEAERSYNAAIAILEDLAAAATDKGRHQYRTDLARSHMNRGIVRKDRGSEQKSSKRAAEATQSFQQSQDDYDQTESLLKELLDGGELTPVQREECRVLLAKTHLNRGVLLRAQLDRQRPDPQRIAAARESYLQAIAQLQTVVAEQPGNARSEMLEYQLDLAKYHNNLANLLMEYQPQEAREEAERLNAEAVRIAQELNVGTPAVRSELANFYHSRGVFLDAANQPEAAIAEWQKAVDVLESIWRQGGDDQVLAERIGRHACNICFFYQKLEKHEEALRSVERLAHLKCRKSRFELAARYMEAGRQQVQDHNTTLAGQYSERARLFREKAETAE